MPKITRTFGLRPYSSPSSAKIGHRFHAQHLCVVDTHKRKKTNRSNPQLPIKVNGTTSGVTAWMHWSHTSRLKVIILCEIIIYHLGKVDAIHKCHGFTCGSPMRTSFKETRVSRIHYPFHPSSLRLQTTDQNQIDIKSLLKANILTWHHHSNTTNTSAINKYKHNSSHFQM